MSEPSARARFVEAMRRIFNGLDRNAVYDRESLMRQATGAFADVECGLRERGGLWTVDWMKQHRGDGHAACRAALIKEVFGE